MTLFRSDTHREIWISHNCHRCFEPHEAQRRLQGKDTCCPILASALKTDRKPPEWDRMPRSDEMARSIRCNAFRSRPDRIYVGHRHTEKQYEDVAMFDVEAGEVPYVPVAGWPDRPRPDEVDHA